MVSFVWLLSGVAMSFFFFHSVFNFMVGVARFSFSFQWGTPKLFSRDFSQAPKDRCGVASGGLGDWGTSVIGRGAWSSFSVGNDPADLCSMENFGDEPTLGGGRVLPRWVSYIPTDRRLRLGDSLS